MNRKEWESLSLEKAIAIQNQLASQIIPECTQTDFQTIAGVDLAYWKTEENTDAPSEEYGVCCIVVIDRKTKTVVENKYAAGKVEVPYIPGCLAFRELPLVIKTADLLTVSPDLYLFDGNGYLHPRHMGIAVHASFYLNKPTIGIAKSYYKISEDNYPEPPDEAGSYADIVINNEIYGRVLRTHRQVKPIFVSIGNYMDLETAAKIAMEFVTKESHIPLPTRLADIETHKMRKILTSPSPSVPLHSGIES